MRKFLRYAFFFFLLLAGCRRPYDPPAINANHNYLVVEGVINVMPDSKTTIILSRTRNLADTFLTNPEKSAKVAIEAKAGAVYPLQEQANAEYTIDHLTLNKNDSYRLKILTADGRQYLSDY